VEIKKEGFHPWQKNLEIKENFVISFNDIFLIPENPKYTVLAQKVEDLFFSPDQKKLILKEKNDKNWSLKIIEFSSFPAQGEYTESNLFSGFQSTEVELSDLKFSQDSNRILLITKEKEIIRTPPSAEILIPSELRYWILELRSPIQEQTPDNLISLDFLGDKAGVISFNPQDIQKIFFLKGTVHFSANISTKKVDLNPILNDIISYEIYAGNLFWLSNDGFLFKADLSGGNAEKLNSELFLVKKDKKYQIYIKSPLLFLKEDEVLYILKPNSRTLEKFSEFIKDIKFSPDGRKMLYFNNYEIDILFLEKKESQPQKEALEKLFLTRFSEKIGQVLWLNSDYLAFNVGNKIKISEIDDRDKLNIYDFGEFPALGESAMGGNSPKMSFNQSDKKLYILSEGSLYVSVKLLP
jgi:hypothetical protein